jgi:hypothetical protein
VAVCNILKPLGIFKAIWCILLSFGFGMLHQEKYGYYLDSSLAFCVPSLGEISPFGRNFFCVGKIFSEKYRPFFPKNHPKLT